MRQSFSSYYQLAEQDVVKALHEGLAWSAAEDHSASSKAAELIGQIRAKKMPAGQLERFLQDYSLSTDEGIALMSLAEALLRIPDNATAHALIRDKVAAANWLERGGRSKDWVVKAAGLGLFMSSKTLDSLFARVGEPFVREAMAGAMAVLGKQFVLGRDIEEAVQNAQNYERQGYRMSYDILGEGARTAVDAQHYFASYAAAIKYIGERSAKGEAKKPGISVKLSALHPRYHPFQAARCVPEMAASLRALCALAAGYDLPLTVDAEESERLDISVAIIERVLADASLKGWCGFGLAVQAYHKAAPALIDHMIASAKATGRRIQMRLVKGAYWDSEIKKAQVAGLADFPVYTRKCHTDTSYLACAAKMFAGGETVFPMFATHNALTAASILEMAKAWGMRFEFQRLFGMGQALHDLLLQQEKVGVSVYAPVGPHQDLLPYLVRRLLENGANTSFVNLVLNPDAPVDGLVASPVDKSRFLLESKHPKIALPKELFLHEKPMGRINSAGVDLHAPEIREQLQFAAKSFERTYEAMSLINGRRHAEGLSQGVLNPADQGEVVGGAVSAGRGVVDKAFAAAFAAFAGWAGEEPEVRACALERAADMLEDRRAEFMALLVREAGKTWGDALSEVREAADFLRYYAAQGRGVFRSVPLPGPTGESNRLQLHGRGTFVCISPWNFPLAIFTGQIAAALMAGNCVIAKPAEQTPLIGALMVEILHTAGVHPGALALVIGDGTVGEALTQHRDAAGVAFTGSTSVARAINRVLASKDGPIVPLIAETGGQNAMIVDSSALPEQVVDDAILSAFGSAGQRCSALRVLCLQEDCADKIIRLLKGAMAELRVGDPKDFASDIGPIIDEDARAGLLKHREALGGFGKLVAEVELDAELVQKGFFFGPCAYEIPSVRSLKAEVFGPILHIVRYKRAKLDDLLEDIQNTGYGLTLGVHSRIETFQERIVSKMQAGNIYVNRSMIGAVVGSQPFGGMGLSGTGPKAGGPHYLARFATEKTVSVNTTAAGGNASLVSLEE